jgi:hypothetical protein
MDRPGIQLWFLAILVFGIIVLGTLGLLIARRFKAARIMFAAGLLATSVIAAVAMLTFIEGGITAKQDNMLFVVTALNFLLAGAGQFIAALRRPRVYAVTLGCVAISQLVLWPALGGDLMYDLLGPFALRHQILVAVVGLLFAAASVLVAVFYPRASRQVEETRSEASEQPR